MAATAALKRDVADTFLAIKRNNLSSRNRAFWGLFYRDRSFRITCLQKHFFLAQVRRSSDVPVAESSQSSFRLFALSLNPDLAFFSISLKCTTRNDTNVPNAVLVCVIIESRL